MSLAPSHFPEAPRRGRDSPARGRRRTGLREDAVHVQYAGLAVVAPARCGRSAGRRAGSAGRSSRIRASPSARTSPAGSRSPRAPRPGCGPGRGGRRGEERDPRSGRARPPHPGARRGPSGRASRRARGSASPRGSVARLGQRHGLGLRIPARRDPTGAGLSAARRPRSCRDGAGARASRSLRPRAPPGRPRWRGRRGVPSSREGSGPPRSSSRRM